MISLLLTLITKTESSTPSGSLPALYPPRWHHAIRQMSFPLEQRCSTVFKASLRRSHSVSLRCQANRGTLTKSPLTPF